jgi:hypothetical protein
MNDGDELNSSQFDNLFHAEISINIFAFSKLFKYQMIITNKEIIIH